MKRHTYSLLMALIRLAKGGLSACETWVRMDYTGEDRPTGSPSTNQKASEE